MAGASYVCQIGCMTECEHGEPCAIYMFDREHPHPTERGHPAHVAWDGELTHEWRGEHGRCRTNPSPEES